MYLLGEESRERGRQGGREGPREEGGGAGTSSIPKHCVLLCTHSLTLCLVLKAGEW